MDMALAAGAYGFYLQEPTLDAMKAMITLVLAR